MVKLLVLKAEKTIFTEYSSNECKPQNFRFLNSYLFIKRRFFSVSSRVRLWREYSQYRRNIYKITTLICIPDIDIFGLLFADLYIPI